MMNKIFLLLILTLVLACNGDSERYPMLYGSWECTSWTSEASDANRCNNNVFFTFRDDKTYESTITRVEDIGTYHLKGKILEFSPENKMQINVEIDELTDNKLSFWMNRGGVSEKMVLKKVSAE